MCNRIEGWRLGHEIIAAKPSLTEDGKITNNFFPNSHFTRRYLLLNSKLSSKWLLLNSLVCSRWTLNNIFTKSSLPTRLPIRHLSSLARLTNIAISSFSYNTIIWCKRNRWEKCQTNTKRCTFKCKWIKRFRRRRKDGKSKSKRPIWSISPKSLPRVKYLPVLQWPLGRNQLTSEGF